MDPSAEVTWATPKKEGHADYKRNLESAKNFVEKAKKSLLNGMDVKICDGESIQKALLIISWKPPKESPLGGCATPISLHQPASIMNKQVEGVWGGYMRSVGAYQARNPGFLPPDQKA